MIKIDTIDKKPNLLPAVIWTAVFAVFAAVVFLTLGADYAVYVSLGATFYFAGLMAILVFALVGQVRYNPYSYNTIFYSGFSLFLITPVVIFAINTFRMYRMPDLYTARTLLHNVNSSVIVFMMLSLPFAIVFAAALCLSNVSLIRHEGFSFVNILGILFSFGIVGFGLLLFRLDYYVSGSQTFVMIHDLLTGIMYCIWLYAECMLIGTIFSNQLVLHYKPGFDKDFIIILGCSIRRDGTPTPLLRGRIDRALDFRNRQKAQTGREVSFIVSGGQGPDEVIAESECMKNYLTQQGIPPEQVIEENRSTNTLENMTFSKEIIDGINPGGKVIFSTNGYHVFRSGIFARQINMRAQGIGSRTKWYFWPNASVRELIGLLTGHKGKQAAVLLGIIIVYSVMVLLKYSQ
ncbi:MAG: YdcF family protein [Clostridiales bacterium]|nr:YdcF family protein [Clostridiales bacterium]